MTEPKLVPVFMPALIVLLLHSERAKCSPLTEAEVLAIRDNAVCVMLRQDHADAVDEKRGYKDLDPELAWEQWMEARAQLAEPSQGENGAASDVGS